MVVSTPSSVVTFLVLRLHSSTFTSTLKWSFRHCDSTAKSRPILNNERFIPIPNRPTVLLALGASSGRPNLKAYF